MDSVNTLPLNGEDSVARVSIEPRRGPDGGVKLDPARLLLCLGELLRRRSGPIPGDNVDMRSGRPKGDCEGIYILCRPMVPPGAGACMFIKGIESKVGPAEMGVSVSEYPTGGSDSVYPVVDPLFCLAKG